jgi:hypothetical protein
MTMTYKLGNNCILRALQDGVMTIPINPDLIEYRDYLDWISAGNTPEPADVPVQAPASVTPLQYTERFTEAEQIAVVTAAMSNAQLRLWYDKLMAAQEVVFTDSRLVGGLDALVAAGLITADRKAELLTP